MTLNAIISKTPVRVYVSYFAAFLVDVAVKIPDAKRCVVVRRHFGAESA